MKNINNPFLISGYESPEYFCDRKQETQTIVSALYNDRNITLVSPRRMGKSGLIKNVFHEIQAGNTIFERDAYLFFIDTYNTHCQADFITRLASSIIGTFDKRSKKLLKQFVTLISSCRPTLTYDPITGVPQLSLDLQPQREDSTLRDIFNYLAKADKPCIVAIDEFQQIATYPEKGLEATLRSYIQFMTHTRFIFSGSRQHLMREMFASPQRPFFQSTQIMSLQPIDPEQYYAFAQSFFQDISLTLDRCVFDRIYDICDGTTWYVQMLLNRLYEQRKTPVVEHVASVMDEILREYNDTYAFMFSHMPRADAKLMVAIARQGTVRQVTSKDFLLRHKLGAASTVQRAIARLVDNDWALSTPDGYQVYDRFFAFWLARQ